MCLAIVKPAAVDVPVANLREGWIHNPDGGGFAYIHKGKVKIEKGFKTLADFLTAYEAATKKHKKSPFLIHFRIKTHGDKSDANTHPFPIEGGALIHNGTISGTGATSDGKSDTCLFAEKISGKVTRDVLRDNLADWNSAIDYNKIAFLFDDGQYVILGEKNGNWTQDVWYSNFSYRQYNTNYNHNYGRTH